jgi:hypothetical protein
VTAAATPAAVVVNRPVMEASMMHDRPWSATEPAKAGPAMEATVAWTAVRASKGTNRNGRDANRNYEFLVHFCLLS